MIERSYPIFDPASGSIHINQDQYFLGCSQDMWNYKVGSYTALKSWLEARQGHALGASERRHFETFVTAIKKY